MNMLLHGVKDSEFEMHHGDSLLNDWDILNEMNPAKKLEFDAIVANPPFSYRWEPTGGHMRISVSKLWVCSKLRRLCILTTRLSLSRKRGNYGNYFTMGYCSEAALKSVFAPSY